MLFNSYIFIFIFLPVTLSIFFLIGGRGHHRVAISWLVAASLFFYGWWNPSYLGLILFSILFNYALGVSLSNKPEKIKTKCTMLIIGIITNMGLLGYFKYSNFFIDSLNTIIGTEFNLKHIILPLAISFFTFQQVAYLIDAYRNETKEYNFLHYCLFVTFFPQLIAGPIVHHREMLPQFSKNTVYHFNYHYFTLGLTMFFLGLFKKVVIADGIAVYASPVFNAAAHGEIISFFEAWAGALAYTLQLYFDFSGYSDMAIGLALMFGVKLPINFNSPYKSINIIEFWRRWHMTLSRFLRDYVYIPLGGSRNGSTRRYTNLLITMLLGGLWHGAGWTFVIWGGLHGVYLILNHAWHGLRKALGHDLETNSWWGRCIATIITFNAVLIAWVFFRAENFDAAIIILNSMFGLEGFSLSTTHLSGIGLYGIDTFVSLLNWQISIQLMSAIVFSILMFIIFAAPNTQQIIKYHFEKPNYNASKTSFLIKLDWATKPQWAIIMGIISLYSLLNLSSVSEFLYFQF